MKNPEKNEGQDFEEFRTRLGAGVSLNEAKAYWWAQKYQSLMDDPPSMPLGEKKPRPCTPPEAVEAIMKHPGRRSFVEILSRSEPSPVVRELLEAAFGRADWRQALLLATGRQGGELEKAESSEWLMGANSDELRAFAKCMDEVDGPVKKRAKLAALYCVIQHRLKFGRLPTKKWVRSYLEKAGINLPEKLGRDLFKGPVLEMLPQAKAGRPKQTK